MSHLRNTTNKAGGKRLKGLTLRREAENKLCLEGVKESNETAAK